MGNTASVLEQTYASICGEGHSSEITTSSRQHKRNKKKSKSKSESKRKSNVRSKSTTDHESIFKVSNEIIDCNQSVAGCQCVSRLINGLKYYQSLDIANNELHQDKLIKFCTQTYTALLNDIIHVITKHNDELEEINKLVVADNDLSKCNLSHCSLSRRHFRDRRNDEKPTKCNEEFLFWRDTVDSVHCYVFHLYDAGFRVKTSDLVYDDNNDESDEEEFKMKHFDKQNTKFSINSDVDKENRTYLDGLYRYLLDQELNQMELDKIKHIIKSEEYDSDALMEDIINDYDGTQSNFTRWIENIKTYHKNTKLSEKSFSIGYIFYYWDYYKLKRIHRRDAEFFANKNDHGGFEPHQLYVEPKYQSLQEEILNNTLSAHSILNKYQFKTSLAKAKQYIDTSAVRKLYAGIDGVEDPLHYGIKTGSTLSVHNLLSIVLYCDWSELCTEFSKTFRKIKPWETITDVKQRNREFAIWSKTLRETVEYYGNMGWDYGEDEKWNGDRNTEKGPFYCGMSLVMALPEFNIRLCSPTSTSKQFQVAKRFSNGTGIVIQLNNNGNVGSYMLRSFDCCWLSTYTEEDERLFIGGDWPIKVESVKNMVTNKNYAVFFKPLFYFDCMLSGTQLNDDNMEEIGKMDKIILDNLIKHNLEIDGFKNDYPQYIYDTFQAFTNHKVQIVINPYLIEHGLGVLQDMIMNELMPVYNELDSTEDGNNDKEKSGGMFGVGNFKKIYGKYINSTLGEVGTYAEQGAYGKFMDPMGAVAAGIGKLNDVKDFVIAEDDDRIGAVDLLTNAPQVVANRFLKRKNGDNVETMVDNKDNDRNEEEIDHLNINKADHANRIDTIQLLTNAPQVVANRFLIVDNKHNDKKEAEVDNLNTNNADHEDRIDAIQLLTNAPQVVANRFLKRGDADNTERVINNRDNVNVNINVDVVPVAMAIRKKKAQRNPDRIDALQLLPKAPQVVTNKCLKKEDDYKDNDEKEVQSDTGNMNIKVNLVDNDEKKPKTVPVAMEMREKKEERNHGRIGTLQLLTNTPQIAINRIRMGTYFGKVKNYVIATESTDAKKNKTVDEKVENDDMDMNENKDERRRVDILGGIKNVYQIPLHAATKVNKYVIPSKNGSNNDIDIELKIPNDEKNLFKKILFKIFKNLNHIIIFSTGFDGDPEYILNIYKLLSLLYGSSELISNDIKLTIKASHKYIVHGEEWGQYQFEHIDISWISKLWQNEGKEIRKEYRRKGFDISLIHTTTILLRVYRLSEDRLIIKKL